VKRWWEPEVGEKEVVAVRDVLESGYLNDGKVTRRFENKIKELVMGHLLWGFGMCVPSGTMALFAALKAVDVGPGDSVIIPDLSYIAAANAVKMCGAEVILVDVKAGDLTLDPEKMVQALTPRTKAVIVVHVSGRRAEMGRILEVAENAGLKGIKVIEDSCEAFPKKLEGDVACYSFSPNKIITTGQGGMVVTDDPKIYQNLTDLKYQGCRGERTGGDDVFEALGTNLKFTDIQAAIGLCQVCKLKRRQRKLRKIYDWYREELGMGIYWFDENDYPLWVVGKGIGEAEIRRIKKAGYECRKFWKPIHEQPMFLGNPEKFPESSKKDRVWLPSHFSLNKSDVKKICKAIKGG